MCKTIIFLDKTKHCYCNFSNISREQCREPGAMISFTLMDWDVLTADDFGGEAFIALRLIINFSHN